MRLLILGSLAGQLGAASRIAMARGAKILHAEDLGVALQTLRSGEGVDLVLADVRLDIGALVTQMQAERISVPVVACGLGNDIAAAVAAIKAGAREYLPLPPDPDLIGAILAAATQQQHAIVHADPLTKSLLTLADRVAASEASVLIVGPSGTGKELLARFVHARSRRSKARLWR
jgi:two-component system, response regulator FlrC